MLKSIIIIVVITTLAIAGFSIYRSIDSGSTGPKSSQPTLSPTQSMAPTSPIFSYLPIWVPAATWSFPENTIEETPYGQLTGMKSIGKITGESTFEGRNFEDAKVMSNLGFKTEDIKFAADGPGASQWGYTQTESGQSWVVIFSYSTNRLMGPENDSLPYANLSVFVSDAFEIN